MKKLLIVFALLATVVALVACGGVDTTTAEPDVTTTDGTEQGGKVESFKDFTGTISAAYESAIAGEASGVDVSEYEFFGAATSVTGKVNQKYTTGRKWYLLADDGSKTEITYSEARNLGVIAAKGQKLSDGTNEITIKKIEVAVAMKYEKIVAKTGAYLMLDFYTNVPADYTLTITTTAGGKASGALYKETDIPVNTDEAGNAIGLAKFTVPHTVGKTYYVNINMGTTTIASMPVETVQGDYNTNICKLWMTGCWDRVKDTEYTDKIIYEFYSCFPQILARFAVLGNEPREITVYIEDTDGVAWASGNTVGIGLGWVNERTDWQLKDIGFLSHELGHSAQQFGGKLNYGKDTCYDLNGDGVITDKRRPKPDGGYEDVVGDEYWEAWFTEQMASYSGLRYYHWGTVPEAVDLEKLTPEHNYYFEWSGYGNCGIFFAYVDWYYPTIDKNGNGKVDDGERGVLDALYWLIKNTKKELLDNPYDPETPFNQAVYEATGGKYKNLPEIYEDFVADMKSGAWVFTGFAEYKDNWLSENIEGVANPVYPVYKAVEPGDVTHEAVLQKNVKADTVVLPVGTNIATGATVIQSSGQYNDDEGVSALFDGKLDTNWRALTSDQSAVYKMMELQHGFIIDLGEVKSFDTYAIVNAGIAKSDTLNTASWEILISTDGKTYTSIDTQINQAADAVTVEVGTQSARYIEVRIHKATVSGSGKVQIFEMVFVKTT